MAVNVDVRNVTNIDIRQAQEMLRSSNLLYRVEGNGARVIDQIPESGLKSVQQSEVVLLTEGFKSTSLFIIFISSSKLSTIIGIKTDIIDRNTLEWIVN
ncbi:PASTA domain-containing protein [Petroclostridium sp. X23]|uniref:PASTA domain-containing protein n=1 Tax=Petroclostridium sp. X23 TaxID=3045146 RepID=UPI0024AE73E1|nr:PASTA domain-containing protein [Petroclostridium sp. X23]WHH60145.1 hypothetical protein QKW49_05255 [Petroclostridium sp. X23]